MLRLLPIIIIGAIASAINSFFVPSYQHFLHTFANGIIHNTLTIIHTYTSGCFSIFFAYSLGIAIAEQKQCHYHEQTLLGIMSTAAFCILLQFGQENILTFSISNFSVNATLIALIAAYITSNSYHFFKHQVLKNNKKKATFYTLLFNKTVSHVGATSCALFVSIFIGLLYHLILEKMHFTNPVYTLFTRYFAHHQFGMWDFFVCIVAVNISWIFGIHAHAFSYLPHYSLFLNPASEQNLTLALAGQPITNPYSSELLSFINLGGAGQTLSLVIAILLFSTHGASRKLAKSSIIPSLFNINEPLIFGLPIVANPILAVPFIMTPVISFFIVIAAIKTGIMPIPVPYSSWSTPPIIMGILNTKSIMGGIVQLVYIITGVCIYHPFVLLSDKYHTYTEKRDVKKLEHLYRQAESTVSDITLVELPGTAGIIARFLAADLQSPSIAQQFQILYQPQFDNNMHIFGVEALLRWNHPVFGSIYPPLTFKLAAEAGVLTEIEEIIFLLVQKDLPKYPQLKFSINATPVSLRDSQFIDFIQRTYADTLHEHYNVFIEVTEQNKLITDEILLDNMQQLREVGFKLAIDDFSMGHTSLRYLQENKFDLVKLDGAFTKNMIENPKTQHIIDSIVYLGKTSGFSVLAEYVETPQQQQTLTTLGCTQFQGNLCSKPVTIEKLDTILQS